MKVPVQKLPLIGVLASMLVFVCSVTVSAHVTVKPAEVVTAGYQTFTVNVPNEKAIPTTSIKVLLPPNIEGATPTQKVGWQVAVEKKGTGEATAAKSITWSGGTIGEGLRDEFTFSAKVPDQAGEVQWKAYQTYSDGTVVAWDKKSEGGHGEEGESSGPYSVTRIVSETAQDNSARKAEQAAADAKTTANRALYVAIAGVAIGLAGIAFATRKK